MELKEYLKNIADDYHKNQDTCEINLINKALVAAAEKGHYHLNYPLTCVTIEDDIIRYYRERNIAVDTIITDDYGLTLHIDWS